MGLAEVLGNGAPVDAIGFGPDSSLGEADEALRAAGDSSTGGLSFRPSSQPKILAAIRWVALLSEEAAGFAVFGFSLERSDGLALDGLASAALGFSAAS